MNHRMRMPVAVLAALFAAAATQPGRAQTGTAADYDACMALVAQDPAAAEWRAGRWAGAGGGAPALHCRAMALLAMGAEYRAAEQLVALAADRTLEDALRYEVLVEAGGLYLGLGDAKQARALADRAMELNANPAAALALSARARAEVDDWAGAVDDLDRALEKATPEAGMLVLRAAAKRHMGDLAGARADLARAEELSAETPDLWLERGAVEAAAGDRDAARAAWLRAIELDRDGPTGAAARLSLQRMDAAGG